jgi:hypothetical protein
MTRAASAFEAKATLTRARSATIAGMGFSRKMEHERRQAATARPALLIRTGDPQEMMMNDR